MALIPVFLRPLHWHPVIRFYAVLSQENFFILKSLSE